MIIALSLSFTSHISFEPLNIINIFHILSYLYPNFCFILFIALCNCNFKSDVTEPAIATFKNPSSLYVALLSKYHNYTIRCS